MTINIIVDLIFLFYKSSINKIVEKCKINFKKYKHFLMNFGKNETKVRNTFLSPKMNRSIDTYSYFIVCRH